MLDYSDLEGETLPGMVPRAQLDKTTDSIVSRLKPGQYSAPFLAGYGWQIALLDTLTKDSIRFRRILVRVKMGAEPLAAVRDSVRSFIEKTANEDFDTVATRFGLAVQQARPIVGDQQDLPGLGIESPVQLVAWARAAKPGQVYDLPQRGTQGYYVFRLAEVKPAGYQDFEKVKAAASWRVRQEKEKKLWSAMAGQALEAIKAGKALEQYAQENTGVELQTEEFNGLSDCRRKKGPEFAGALAALNPGEKYGVVETNWGAFIIRCDQRTTTQDLDAAKYNEQRRQEVAQSLMQVFLKQPEVKDYRDALAY
jgi:parvulin-like peptidyl-prolyl isomerase